MSRTVRTLAAAALAFATLAPAHAADPVKSGLPVGADQPGPFQVLSVLHPDKSQPGKYHAPVCEAGLNPLVLIFVNELAEAGKPQPLTTLLKGLDEAVARHTDVSLAACLISLNDGGYRDALENKTDDLATAITTREAEEARLKQLAGTAGAKAVALSLDAKGGPKGYQVNPDAAVTVLIFVKQKVQANYAFGKDNPLTDPDAAAILAEVEKLTAGKKPAKPKRAAPRPAAG